jgi:uncharacterized protein
VLSARALVAGLAMAPLMILGSYAGKRIVDRVPERAFVVIIELTMVAAGLLFLVRGPVARPSARVIDRGSAHLR